MVRADFAESNQKGSGTKEAEMKIVDSLLNFNFFLSGEVQENLSFFPQAAHIARESEANSTRHNLDPSYE
jgi:hypothetical protein